MQSEPVQAVVLGTEPEEEEPGSRLPMDHAGMITSSLPLLGLALFLVIFLVMSWP